MEPLKVERRPVVIVGAGLSGMVLALDLARRGQRVTLLERSDGVLRGSRAITYSPTTLEVLWALGCAEPILAEAVRWSTGTEFLAARKLRSVAHAEASAERFTGYCSLPQPVVHDSLMAKIKASALVDLRLACEVKDVCPGETGAVSVRAVCHGADVTFRCDYLVAADGAHSTVRKALGLRLHGDRTADTFLICDLDTAEPLATDRTVWFDPPFARGRVALLLRYAERKYRFDVHVPGWARADADEAAVHGVIREAFGAGFAYRLDFWTTYEFTCQMLEAFRCGPVFFVGDAAHVVPPFGARGGNGAVADVFNLSWKLAGVLQGRYAEDLLLTYATEAQEAARHDLVEVGKTMRFLVPQTALDHSLRNAALALCEGDRLAQDIVNSGRMSRPPRYGRDTQVHLTEGERAEWVVPVLKKLPNVPMRRGGERTYLHDGLGENFTVVVLALTEGSGRRRQAWLRTELAEFAAIVSTLVVVEAQPSAGSASTVLWDEGGALKAYLDGRGHALLLIRPDRYLVGVVGFLQAEPFKTLLRATGRPE